MLHHLKFFTYNNVHFIVIGSIGGFLVGLTGLSMGWMLGSLLSVSLLNFYGQKNGSTTSIKLHPIWKGLAQMILAIQVGNHLDASMFQQLISGRVMVILIVFTVLILLSAFGMGVLFSKVMNTSLMTGLLAVCPGGVSTIPMLSKDLEGDSFLVTTIQVIRVSFVACSIPAITAAFQSNPFSLSPSLLLRIEPLYESHIYELLEFCHGQPYLWTLSLFLGGLSGYLLFRFFKFPSALLIGSLLGAGFLQYLASAYLGQTLNAWIPNWFSILMQIFIGVNIGITFKPDLLLSWKKTLPASLIVVVALITVSLIFSCLAHFFLAIPFSTAILSLAPGSIAVMVACAIQTHANPAFVASIQTVRMFLILLSLFVVSIVIKPRRKLPS